MKKPTARILSALLILALAGCGKAPEPTQPTTAPTVPTTVATVPVTDPTEPTTLPTEPPTTEPKFQPDACRVLFGSWEHTMTLDRELMALPEFQGSTDFSVVWSFLEDGTYTVEVDGQQMEDAISGYEALLIDYMVDSRYRMFVADCNRKGKYEAYIQREWVENGLGQQERQKATETVAALELRTRLALLNCTGEYYVKDDALYLDEMPCPFTVEQDTLILTEGASPVCQLLPAPLILERVGA